MNGSKIFFICFFSLLQYSMAIADSTDFLVYYWPINQFGSWDFSPACKDSNHFISYSTPSFIDNIEKISLTWGYLYPDCIGNPFGVEFPSFILKFKLPSQIFCITDHKWLLADFSIPKSDSFFTGRNDSIWIKVLSRDSTVTNCYGLTFDSCIVFSNGAIYAPHVGPINYLISYHSRNVTVEPVKVPSPPTGFTLHQNYPNPFNGETAIAFDLPEPGELTLIVTDLLGREIRALARGRCLSGSHRVHWNGANQGGQIVPSGLYLIRLQVGGNVQTIKAVYTR